MGERFLFVLNGPTSNRGCEAILLSTYQLLSGAYPEASFVNSSFRDPRVEKERYMQLPGLRHAAHPEMLSMQGVRWQIAKRIQGHAFNFERFLPWADYVLSLGGDNYSMDYGSARTYFDANERILTSGKKLVIWGASIGPFDKDPVLERYAAEHLKRLHKLVVRESRSKSYLESLGVRNNVVLMPDPAFSLGSENVVLPQQIETMLDAGAIGINLSPLLARYRPEPAYWVEEAAKWVDTLAASTKYPILLIPHVMQPGNDDAAFMAEIMARISANSGRLQLLAGDRMSSKQLKYVISRLRCFVGARTHATIAALSKNVPTLSIGYSIKARGINEDLFGSDRWVVEHLNLATQGFVDKVKELLAEETTVRATLIQRNQTYRMNSAAIRNLLE